MREIKFRAWSHIGKMMLYTEKCSGISILMNEPTLKFPIKEPVRISFGEYELMQFTGMKDCAGKEIYEGDIVRTDDEDEELATIDWGDDTLKFMVTHGNVCSDLGEYYPRNIEVIGNIYDNPELLGGADDEH